MATTDPTTGEAAPQKERRRRRRGSQLVFRRKRSNGTYYDGWWIRFTDAFGERHLEFGGDSKDAAEALLGKRRSEKYDARRTGHRPVGRVTLADLETDLLDHWRATLTPSTVSGRTGILTIAKTYFGGRP